MTDTFDNSDMKRTKKPKPLFGLFRKNKPEPVLVVPSSSATLLGSGISSVPLHSILTTQQQPNDPYAPPRLPKDPTRNPLLSPQFNNYSRQQPQQQQYQRRPRSKSVGRDPSSSHHMRLMEERESALNKLCQKEINSPTSSLADSLPLLSPTYTPPPVPPIPLRHQQSPRSPQPQPQPQQPQQPQQQKPPAMRKFSSAHDLRKAAKLQQDSIIQAQDKPLPTKKDLSRSKSLNNGPPRKLHASKSQQQLGTKIPTTPNVMMMSRPRWPPIRSDDDDDDDDIPLGYLQSPISKPSSLLSDQEEDDDKDLVPIAVLNIEAKVDIDYQTAADKYKEKVKERLQFDIVDDDDDDIPISLLSKRNKK